MAVSEFTIPDRGLIRPFTPATGVYLAITLDPEATVQHLQDPIATQEAKAIATSVYIGFVSHRVDLVSPDRAYHLCDCHIVSRGLPVSADPSDGLDETMCLGIGPSQHPEGRKSVNPQPPLPWSNLYHHTVPDIRIRLRTQPGDYTKCSLVTWKDLNELLFWSEMDGSRRSDAVNNYFAAHPEDPRAQTRLKRAPERLGRPYLSPYLVSGAFDSSSISGGSSDASDTAATGLLGSSHADSDMSGFYVGSAKTRPLPGNLQGDPIAQQLFGYDSPYNRFVPLASFNMDITSDLEFSSADSFLREAREIKR
ncbi:hypothetical protein FA95DRAFT_1500545 [Auriscalpium vulgare]|uniref:Uncharacterized protein n=1 Tax=Auriscalpium vulgare TaxID=40419 RepID=A0ACB8RD69_9AGAM|nr:hypothetical protein FA95DRAFT_1500545 [Auriscalpium vulgare]